MSRATWLEVRTSVNSAVLILFGVMLPVAYGAAAFGAQMWGMLAGIPFSVVGAVLVVVGERRRHASDGDKIGVSIIGGLLVVGSIWVAFVTNNALLP